MRIKNIFRYNFFNFIGLTLIAFSSCKKDNDKNLAILTTTEVTSITATTATSGGNISNDGGAPVISRGMVWSTNQNPTKANNQGITSAGTGTGKFNSYLTSLIANTTYYIRAYASNSVGTQYGNQVTFTTSMPDGPGENITDADGNIYNTIWINGRQWMKENLKTTKYRDSTSISYDLDNGFWNGTLTPTYCWYNHDQATYGESYGALYNWYAVSTGKLCPTGWHVPSDVEWYTMENYIDHTINDTSTFGWRGFEGGAILKSTSGWFNDGFIVNCTVTDNYGFSALPGGFLNSYYRAFNDVGRYGLWWSSSDFDDTNALARKMSYIHVSVARYASNKKNGFSVRCIRDN